MYLCGVGVDVGDIVSTRVSGSNSVGREVWFCSDRKAARGAEILLVSWYLEHHSSWCRRVVECDQMPGALLYFAIYPHYS